MTTPRTPTEHDEVGRTAKGIADVIEVYLLDEREADGQYSVGSIEVDLDDLIRWRNELDKVWLGKSRESLR